MRILSVIGVACAFAGTTLVLNDLIAAWWGDNAGVSASQARVSVTGVALAVLGIVLALGAGLARARPKPKKPAVDAEKAKPEKVVLYEHGPDQPY